MATKELSLTVRAVDQFTAPMRNMMTLGAASFSPVITAATKLGNALFSVKSAVLAVGTALLGGAGLRALDNTAEQMDAIGKAARNMRLGLTVEELSNLRYVAGDVNLDFQALAGQIGTAQKNLGQFATTGGGKAAEAFKLLGIHARDSRGQVQSINALLPQIADGINGLSDAQARYAATAIFGDASVLNLLSVGGDALRQRGADASRFGVVFTPEMIRAATEYRNAIYKVSQAWFGVKAMVVQEVAPALTGMLESLATFLGDLPDRIKLVGRLFRDLFSPDDEARAYANTRMAEMLQSLGSAAVEAFRLSGEFAGQAFASALLAGMASLKGRLGDFLQDSLAKAFISGPLASSMDMPWTGGKSVSEWAKGMRSDGTMAREQIAAKEQEVDQLRDRVQAAVRRMEADRSNLYKGQGTGVGGTAGEKYFAGSYKALQAPVDAARLELARAENNLELMRRDLVGRERRRTEEARRELGASGEQLAQDAAAYGERMRGILSGLGIAYSRRPQDPGGPLAATEGGAEQMGPFLPDALRPFVTGAWRETLGRMRDNLAAFSKGTIEAFQSQFTLMNERILGVRARLLAARGDQAGADLINLRLEQAKELREASGRGESEYEITQRKELYALQLQNLRVDAQATQIKDALTAAEERYRDVLTRNAQLVQAGALQKFQATRQDQQAKDALAQAVSEAETQAAAAIESGPGSEHLLGAVRRKVEEIKRILGESGREAGQTFSEGLAAGFREWIDKASDVFAQARDGIKSIADSVSGGLANAFTDAITGVKSFGDAFRDMAISVLRDITRITTQMLVVRAITGIAGAFAGGGDVAGAAGGSARFLGPRASGGPVIGGGAYLVGERGPEIFVPRQSGSIVANGAGGAGGVVVNQVVNLGGGGGRADETTVRDLKRATVEGVLEALQRSPAFRNSVKGALA